MFPLRDDNPRRGPAPFTWLVIGVNLVVFLLQPTGAGGFFAQLELFRFLQRWAFVPGEFFAAPFAEAPTLVTSLFLHGGWAHLIGNLFFLWVFADNVEETMGTARFSLFYLLGGVAATLLHGLFQPASPVPLVGASGAISAALGAYILLFPRNRVLTLVPPLIVPWLVLSFVVRVPRFFLFWIPAWLYIGYWALIQFLEAGNGLLMPQGMGNVAWWAHVGGFVYGVLLVRRFVPRGAARAAGAS